MTLTLLKSVGLAAGCLLAVAPALALDPMPSFNDNYIPEFTKNPGPYVAATAGSSASTGASAASAPASRSPMFPAHAGPAPSFTDYAPWGPAQEPATRRIARSPVSTSPDGTTNADRLVQPTR
jgi:hypothetical protein